MIGKTHRIGGLAFGAAASAVLLANTELTVSIPLTTILLTGAELGSLIPDLDHKGAELSRDAKLASWLVRHFADHRGLTHYGITALVFGIIVFLLNWTILKFSNSYVLGFVITVITQSAISLIFEYTPRKIKRKYGLLIRFAVLVLGIICTLVSFKLTSYIVLFYCIGLSVGYFSHLFLDALTVSGIPLLGKNHKNFKLANLRTGESEKLVSLCCYLVTFTLLGFTFI